MFEKYLSRVTIVSYFGEHVSFSFKKNWITQNEKRTKRALDIIVKCDNLKWILLRYGCHGILKWSTGDSEFTDGSRQKQRRSPWVAWISAWCGLWVLVHDGRQGSPLLGDKHLWGKYSKLLHLLWPFRDRQFITKQTNMKHLIQIEIGQTKRKKNLQWIPGTQFLNYFLSALGILPSLLQSRMMLIRSHL